MARPKNVLHVLRFFEKNNWPAIEGKKFYIYYETKDWNLTRELKIINRKVAAGNFVEKGNELKQKRASPFFSYAEKWRDDKNKNYDLPL